MIKICVALLLVIAGCKKETDAMHDQLIYGNKGKEFTFESYVSGKERSVLLSIPANAISGSNEMLEYYDFYLKKSEDLDRYYINYLSNNINLFRTTAGELLKPATIKIPFPSNLNYVSFSPYKPYKVKLDGRTDMMAALNDTSNWQLISNFTWDNTEKLIIFTISDLNAAYVLARPK